MSELTRQMPSELPTMNPAGGILERIPRWLLAVVAGIAPAVITLALVNGYLGRNLFDFRPANWNDQVYYWHQILTFKEAGFDGGYYAVYEKPPTLDGFRFGASGFLYPALFGTIGRLTGWQPYTGILFNMVMIAAATWVVIYFARFNRMQIALTSLLLLTISPVLLFMPTIMQESLHQAIGLVLAVIFYRLFQRKTDLPLRWVAAGIGFWVVISLVRFSWVLLLLPFLLLSQKTWSWRRVAASFVVTGIFGVGILFIFQHTSAPGNNSIFERVELLSSSPLAGIEAIWDAMVENLEDTLTISDLRRMETVSIVIIQFFALLIGLLLGRHTSFHAEAAPETRLAAGIQRSFHVYNLLMILGTSLLLYLSNGYYRVFTPHILLTGVLLIAFKQFRLIGALIVIGLFGVGPFLRTYHELDMSFAPRSPAQIEQMKAPFEQHVSYEQDAANPWCNTLLMDVQFLNTQASFIPAGIGISFLVDPALQPTPLKSQYAWLSSYSYAVLSPQANLEALSELPGGVLYRNLDADCP